MSLRQAAEAAARRKKTKDTDDGDVPELEEGKRLPLAKTDLKNISASAVLRGGADTKEPTDG